MTGDSDPATTRDGAAGHRRTILEIGPDGVLTFDAAAVGPLLGLSGPDLLDEIRKGLVYQVHEIGTGPDEGTRRITFRYRARELRVVIDGAGDVLTAEGGRRP